MTPVPCCADVRAALGGDAVLEAVKAFSVTGSLASSRGFAAKNFQYELMVMYPDHFMTIRRDTQSGAPIAIDITYYDGFRGNELIRRTDSNIPFPPDPGPQTPQAIAQRQADALLGHKREFARLTLLLFGNASSSYLLQFSYVGTDTELGKAVEIIEGRAADGHALRLSVDAATRLPARMTWQAPAPVVVTTSSSSTVAVRRGETVSQTPLSPPSVVVVPRPGAPVTWEMVPSDFTTQNGLTWPRRIRVLIGERALDDMRFGRFKINPKIDARAFGK